MSVIRTNQPVMYSDWHRHWYRVADFVQTTWHRFAQARTGRFTIWFGCRAMLIAFRAAVYVTRAAVYVALAAIVVGAGVLYVFLMFALGNGKLSGVGR